MGCRRGSQRLVRGGSRPAKVVSLPAGPPFSPTKPAPCARKSKNRPYLCCVVVGLDQAWALLEDLTRREARGLAQPLLDSPAKRERLREALLVRRR